MDTAIIIPCHNYGRFLGEALDSALAQSVAPVEVVVVDDASTDDTAEVAGRYVERYGYRGMRYLRIEARDVHQARGTGFRATTAEFVCCLDADDVLPADYMASGLPLFRDPRVGIIYSDFSLFGDVRGLAPAFPPFDAGLLEARNFMHAGSLFRRSAAEIAGVFDRPAPCQSHADWWLWRTIVEAGFTGAKSPARYHYRKHAKSMLKTTLEQSYFDQAGLSTAVVTIFSPLAGRVEAWHRWTEWAERQTWPHSQCRIVLADTSQDAEFGRLVRRWLAESDYPDARYYTHDVGPKGLADRPRDQTTEAVRLIMRRIYSRLAAELATPFALVVEDDVVPLDDIIERCLREMETEVAAVSAPYRGRHGELVAWSDRQERECMSWTARDVGGTGFGCVLLRRCVLRGETFALPGRSPDYDPAFFARLRDEGWRVRLLGAEAEAVHLSAPPRDPQIVRQELAWLQVEAAGTCAHRSRPTGRYALCNAHRGGIDPHWAVTVHECLACIARGEHLP